MALGWSMDSSDGADFDWVGFVDSLQLLDFLDCCD